MMTAVHFTTLLFTCVWCYKVFQDQIPNGNRVPHPCKKGELWDGVGHRKSAGTGSRNSFGIDFKRNGKVNFRILYVIITYRNREQLYGDRNTEKIRCIHLLKECVYFKKMCSY